VARRGAATGNATGKTTEERPNKLIPLQSMMSATVGTPLAAHGAL
jgi:hypothetical protein